MVQYFSNVLHLFSDSVANRGEKLELLVDKTENLNSAVSKHLYFLLFSSHFLL